MTEIPKKRSRLKAGEEVGRLAAYKNIDIVEVESNDKVQQKTASDWRSQGMYMCVYMYMCGCGCVWLGIIYICDCMHVYF